MPSTASPISERPPLPSRPYVLAVLSKPKKSVVRIPESNAVAETILGGRELSFGSIGELTSNSEPAIANFSDGACVWQAYDSPLSFLNCFWQSKETKRLTMTSPTSKSGPIPPPVPVVMTHEGRQSSIICFHTTALANFGPSWDMCESDLKRVTRWVPI